MDARESLTILALDVGSTEEVDYWLKTFSGRISYYKIGLRLFTALGPEIIKKVKAAGARVFLDLKFHDIPNTVADAVQEAVGLGVDMLNLHIMGGKAMMAKAVERARTTADKLGRPPLSLIGVTVLTSSQEEDLARLGIGKSVAALVADLAQQARDAGLGGVVASSQEAAMIKKMCGPEFLVVTPGVRPPWAAADDQKRILTPAEALAQGADYIVVGRPLLKAEHPLQALEKLFH